MRRTLVYGTAAALLTVAVVLTLIGWGEESTAFPDWQALILGLVQGFTELLPISSSGHLILVPWAGDWTYLKEHEEFNKTFDVALHLGTLVAVVAYFWSDLIGYVVCLVSAAFGAVRVETEDEKIAWIIVVATIPAALIGAAFESVIEERLGEPWQIAILMAVFALVLFWADRRPERKEMRRTEPPAGSARRPRAEPGPRARRLAVRHHDQRRTVPRPQPRCAARLSFLLLVPITFGAVLLKGYTDVIKGELPARLGGAVRRRHDRLRRRRPARDQLAPELRARPQLHGVRRLQARARGAHPPRDRVRRA